MTTQPITRRTRRVLAGVGATALAVSLAGCGLDESSSVGNDVAGGGECGGLVATGDAIDPEGLTDVPVVVGSKDFDEQLVLGELTSQYLCLWGADNSTDLNTQGSTQARDKIIRGENDIMWEYTGTGWINYLGNEEPIFDPQEQYDAVKEADVENGVVWGPLSPFNNTYAFAVTEDFANENDVATHSDMAAYIDENPDSTVCVESEFANRPDGYPGFKQAYGITGGDEQSLGTGVVYTQTGNGNCDFGEIFTTDGRIAANNLVVLEDDEAFFPLYNGVPVTSVDYDEQNPEVLEALTPLAESLTTEVMQDLNTRISAEGQSPEQIASDYLVEAGFAEEG
ncbi:glycine betaine ABC transporter substrate-binding protein [Nocardioides lentus]|uniref:Glycine betaine ABC transporter substrate-binding protein n=1 Tax=Nocardioides lentus TaxID=338077 RepID=A0ABN2PL64_9ACTN